MYQTIPDGLEAIVDLHIHSRHSRACSKNLTFSAIAATCAIRGIDIVSTGDFTHPAWFESMQSELEERTPGIFSLKNTSLAGSETRFIAGTEVASIKKHNDKLRRVHHLVFAPNFAAVEKFNKKLVALGCNIRADGRPILGLTSKDILTVALEADPAMMMIPAHAWTPWFGIFGSKGGYDSLDEAFEDLTPHIRAIETGMSSDPLMNWRVPMLDEITLISNSDAHSPQKLGREANVFSFADENAITYAEIKRIIETGDREKFLHTIEFYPQEGKYYFDGHADCGFSCAPEETKKYGGRCPRCQKSLTIGVLSRVADLAGRSEAGAFTITPTKFGDRKARRVPYKSLVPLAEIIADTIGVGVSSKAVSQRYDTLIKKLGNEFFILLRSSAQDIASASSPEIARAVERVRSGDICIKPGYDGVFGTVEVFGENEKNKIEQERFDL